MPRQVLFEQWLTLRKTCPRFEDDCGKACPKFGAWLQAYDGCSASVGKGAASRDAMQKVLDDSDRAQKDIEAGLRAFAGCVKNKDAKLKEGFAAMEKAIRAQFVAN